jgi:hypothetical protein
MYGSQTILESSQAPPPNNCLRSVHCHYRSLYLIYYFTYNLIRTLIFSGNFFECVPTTRRRINLPEGKLGRSCNARKIISGYELILEDSVRKS